MSKRKKTPKRRVIEHRPVPKSPRQRYNEMKETLRDLEQLESQYLAEEAAK